MNPKKEILRFTCKLNTVGEFLFTTQGSPFYYVPKNPDMLIVLRKWAKGSNMRIAGYKMDDDSSFIRVLSVKMDAYNSIVKAKTRRVKAYSELDKLTAESQASKRKINPSGKQSGLMAKGSKEKRKYTKVAWDFMEF